MLYALCWIWWTWFDNAFVDLDLSCLFAVDFFGCFRCFWFVFGGLIFVLALFYDFEVLILVCFVFVDFDFDFCLFSCWLFCWRFCFGFNVLVLIWVTLRFFRLFVLSCFLISVACVSFAFYRFALIWGLSLLFVLNWRGLDVWFKVYLFDFGCVLLFGFVCFLCWLRLWITCLLWCTWFDFGYYLICVLLFVDLIVCCCLLVWILQFVAILYAGRFDLGFIVIFIVCFCWPLIWIID